ncbi:DUF4279 domain-containing protein, partial [Cypionkella sp. TWP1-2-1b2]|uniref:DUF4279 domain-containing protein n=1 Tax=Cypionkella sp. TWP1-2-1b2 TaxID=2804675 RepID=UPI003CF5F0D6
MVAQRLVCRSAENSYAIGTPLSNSADTNREYAYFRAVGSFYPTEMTGILGLEPTECWKAGDSFQRRGHILRRPSSCWKLDSGCNDTEELDAHVNALLARLRGSVAQIVRDSLRDCKVLVAGYEQTCTSDLPHDELALLQR